VTGTAQSEDVVSFEMKTPAHLQKRLVGLSNKCRCSPPELNHRLVCSILAVGYNTVSKVSKVRVRFSVSVRVMVVNVRIDMCPHEIMNYFPCFRHWLVFYMCAKSYRRRRRADVRAQASLPDSLYTFDNNYV